MSIHSSDLPPPLELDPLLRTSEASPGCAGQDLEKKRGKESSTAAPFLADEKDVSPESSGEGRLAPPLGQRLVMRKREVDRRQDTSDEQEPDEEAANRIFPCAD